MMTSLIPSSECRVSSVLQRNVKEVGKQFMFDNNPSTCWNSDQGSPQWVAFKWTENVIPTSILATFQVSLITCIISYNAKNFFIVVMKGS
jgi:hypothetical protein